MSSKFILNQFLSEIQGGTIKSQSNFPNFIGNGSKRILDIVASLFGLILLSPVFIILAILIKRDSPGPVFFKGKRSGKDGKLFDIYKFRTMYERPSSYQGSKVTAKNDTRITPLGGWLRDTKLNELPQLINVLMGDMSLVGPRPEDPDIVDTWKCEIQDEILSVSPGITSPASVIYRHEEKMLNTQDVMHTYMKSILPSKMRLDQLYVRNRSFWLDFDVIIWTFLVLLPRLGAYQPPEKQLFWGPVYRLFRRYVNWFVIDTIVTLTAFWIGGQVWSSLQPFNLSGSLEFIFVVGFSLLFSVSGALMGVNKIDWSKAILTDVVYILQAISVASVVAVFINNLISLFPLGFIIISSILSFYGCLAIRYRNRIFNAFIARIVMLRPEFLATREKVLIVGSGKAGQFAVKLMSQQTGHSAYHIIGFIDDDYYRKDERIHGTRVVGGRNDIPSLVDQYDVGIIIFAIHNIDLKERQEILSICHRTNALVYVLPDFLGALSEITSRSLKKYYRHYSEKEDYKESDRKPSTAEDIYYHDNFLEIAEQVFIRSVQNDTPLSVAMFEIDNLEEITKKYGQTVSDQLWWIVAGHCKKLLRNVDLLGQYESGYFVVLISDIDHDTVRIIVNRLVDHITETPLRTDFGIFTVKLNVGISERNESTNLLTTLFDRALANLIYAKQIEETSSAGNAGELVEAPNNNSNVREEK